MNQLFDTANPNRLCIALVQEKARGMNEDCYGIFLKNGGVLPADEEESEDDQSNLRTLALPYMELVTLIQDHSKYFKDVQYLIVPLDMVQESFQDGKLV